MADGDPMLGRLRPDYGGSTHCANVDCQGELNEEIGAFLFRDLESDKLVVLCGNCTAYVELHHRQRFMLVAL